MHASAGYRVLTDDVPRWHYGGVIIFYCEVEHLKVVAHQTHCPNVTNFQMESRDRRWIIMGCYLPLDNALTIESIISAINHWPVPPRGCVAGD